MRQLLAAAGCLCLGTVAVARPYVIDDALRLEGYGQVLVAPDGKRALVERRGRYDGVARYSYGYQVRRLASRVMTLDLTKGTRLTPAFAQEAGAGYWVGGFAPRGGRFTVFRLKDDRLRLGIADLDHPSVRWLDGAPDLPIAAPAPIWLDQDHFVYLRFEDERLPLVLDHAGILQKTLPQRWRAAAAGSFPSADVAASRGLALGDPRERRALVEVDLAAGRDRVLAEGPILDFLVAPARDRIAVVRSGEPVQPDPGTLITTAYQAGRRRLTIIDVRTGGMSSPCVSCDVATRPLQFSARGDLLVRARRDGEPWRNASDLIVDRSGRVASAQVRGSPDGTAVWVGAALLHARDDGGWSCTQCGEAMRSGAAAISRGGRLIANDGSRAWFADRRGVWRLDAGGKLKLVLSGAIRPDGLDYLDPASAGTRALGMPQLPVVRRVGALADRLLFGFASSPLRTLDLPRDVEVLAVSGVAGAAVGLVTDDHGVGALMLYRSRAAATRVDAISQHLADVELPVSMPIDRRGSDGAPLRDWLIIPRTPGPHPLVVIPYQGSVWGASIPGQARPEYFGSATNVMLLAANGYAVLLPSLPAGPSGAPQSVLLREVDEALDAVIATGLIDPARVALLGHSYGGVNALFLAANSDRFRAVIAASGASDLAASYGELPPAERVWMGGGVPLGEATAWFETGQGQLGAAPWDAPQRYVGASSLFQADRIKSPLLLFGGDLDYVPMEQAERLFVSLTRLGRDATLVRYFGEGHVLQSPANIRLHWRTILSFLARAMPKAGAGAREVVR